MNNAPFHESIEGRKKSALFQNLDKSLYSINELVLEDYDYTRDSLNSNATMVAESGKSRSWNPQSCPGINNHSSHRASFNRNSVSSSGTIYPQSNHLLHNQENLKSIPKRTVSLEKYRTGSSTLQSKQDFLPLDELDQQIASFTKDLEKELLTLKSKDINAQLVPTSRDKQISKPDMAGIAYQSLLKY